MKKSKFSLAIVAMLFAITGAFAFYTPTKQDSKTVVRYHYTSSSSQLADMKNIDNWVAEDPACGSSGAKPCAIDYNGNLAQFETYLGTFTSASQVTAAAIEKKN